MDERVFERMIARSGRTMRHSGALALAASTVFVSATFWIILRVVLGGFGGVFRLPMVFLTAAFSLLPLSLVIVPLAAWCLGLRSGHEMVSLNDAIYQRWKQAAALFLFALAVAFVELLLGVFIAVWCGVEAIPIFGSAVYLFFSWLPTVLTLLMGIILVLHVFVLLAAGTMLAQIPSIEQKGLVAEIMGHLAEEWLLRFKILAIGMLPIVVLYGAATTWTMRGLPQGIEFAASIFRAAAFSVFAAPLFLLVIHMAVEADRYVQWLSSRRVG